MGNHTKCRICRSPLPPPFLDLGATPLANSFLASPVEFKDEPTFPLAVTACRDCGLVQLTYVVPAEQLYRKYVYVSSTSDAVGQYADRLATRLTKRYGWGPSDLVVEVASNDGTVLKAFQRRGLRVLGIEPARNIAELAERDGVPTVPEFFCESTATQQHEQVGEVVAILGRHVFAHIDDLHDFLRGASALLRKDGVLLIEVPYLGELLSNLEFDTVYHEHLSYVSLRPVARLCAEYGMSLVEVEPVDLHGGSILMHIRRAGGPYRQSETVQMMLQQEETVGIHRSDNLERFADHVRTWREQFVDFIGDLERSGAYLIGYGAAAKANTLLNYCPEVARCLSLILDKSPHKQGLLTPGTHIPVRPASEWEASGASHLLILAWNFREEIMRQMQPFAKRGGRFVVPIPNPEVI